MIRFFFILLLITGCSIHKEIPEKNDSCCKKKTVTLNTDDIYYYDLQTNTWWKPLYKVKND